jgi:tetratricopeptide (TPR) repeat protein
VRCLVGGNWLDQAIAELEKMDRDFPSQSEVDMVEIARVRAAAYFARQDVARAEETLKAARTALPQHTALAESMFQLYRQTGKLTNAMALINEQLAQTPTNTMIHLQKAELQLSVQDFDGAHETLDRVLTLAPKSAPAHLLHAFGYIQERDYDKAITVMDRLLRDDSGNVQALLYKGIANFEKGDLDAARKSFDAILSQEPEHQLALRNRAVLHLRAKRWGEAKEDYEKLRRLVPRSHSVMYGLAEVAAEQGREDEAIRYYELYLKYAPANGGPELEEERKRVRERIEKLRQPSK